MEDMSERHDERSPEESSGGQEFEADLLTDISLSMNKAVYHLRFYRTPQ